MRRQVRPMRVRVSWELDKRAVFGWCRSIVITRRCVCVCVCNVVIECITEICLSVRNKHQMVGEISLCAMSFARVVCTCWT